MPVSKTDAQAGTIKGRYKALRRYLRDRIGRAEAEREERFKRVCKGLREMADIEAEYDRTGDYGSRMARVKAVRSKV